MSTVNNLRITNQEEYDEHLTKLEQYNEYFSTANPMGYLCGS